jgi:pyruvate dehydrogenase E2 component (dihydrolipoamide acetyltransferase)/2-oxoisovalerate dehydrogenase E2 component (dihydrolipoyl transacylase)
MEFKLPQLGEGVYEAELVRWLVSAGDAVKPGQGLMEVLTDKATMEVPAAFAGTVVSLHAQSGDTVRVGEHVLSYKATAGVPEEHPAAPPPVKVTADAAVPAAVASRASPAVAAPVTANGTNGTSTTPLPVKASPSVRHLARKLGIDLVQVRGSGPGGRILLEDLQLVATPAGRPAASRRRAGPPLDLGKAGSRVKLVGLRRKIAEAMVRSAQTIPHITYVDECDLTELVKLRASLRDPFEKAGVKLTYLPFFVKAAVLALKEVPTVNATLDDEAGEIVMHNEYHIGIATATPGGLIVPVVHEADHMDIAGIAKEIDRLSGDARAGRARLSDLRGGTFTITSIGGIGGLIATPIINHPEVAILGIGKAVRRPVYDAAGRIKPADMVHLSLSFDHRVIDGAVGATFGNALIKHLQNPARLLLPDRLA